MAKTSTFSFCLLSFPPFGVLKSADRKSGDVAFAAAAAAAAAAASAAVNLIGRVAFVIVDVGRREAVLGRGIGCGGG